MVCENNVKHPTVCMIVGCFSMEYNGDKVDKYSVLWIVKLSTK